jgi:hypothetical protein
MTTQLIYIKRFWGIMVTKNGDYLIYWGVYLGTKVYEVFDNKQRGGNSLTFDVDLLLFVSSWYGTSFTSGTNVIYPTSILGRKIWMRKYTLMVLSVTLIWFLIHVIFCELIGLFLFKTIMNIYFTMSSDFSLEARALLFYIKSVDVNN